MGLYVSDTRPVGRLVVVPIGNTSLVKALIYQLLDQVVYLAGMIDACPVCGL